MKKTFFQKTFAAIAIFSLFAGSASAFLTAEQRHRIPAAKKRELPIKTLPVHLREGELPENLSKTRVRLPQTGNFRGIFTREVKLFGDRIDASAAFSIGTKALSVDGKPFLKTIFPPKRKLKSELPTPQISGAALLGALEMAADEPVFFDPPGTIRFVLPEKQIANENATGYFYNPKKQNWEKLDTKITPNKNGILVPLAQNGIYAFYDRAGKIPETKIVKKEKSSAFVFADTKNHWARDFISRAVAAGIFSAKNPVFRPDAGATRAELIKMIVVKKFPNDDFSKCLDLFPSKWVPVFFTDVSQKKWFAPFVCVAAREKMISGRPDGTFGPNDPLTRAETLFLLMNAADNFSPAEKPKSSPFADVPVDAWFAPAVIAAADAGIVHGKSAAKIPIHLFADRLFLGEKSDEVKKLQKILRELGFFHGPISGEFDFALKEAVFQFQKSRGILFSRADPSAGVVGPNTIAAINALGVRVSPVENDTRKYFRPSEPVTRAEIAKLAVEIWKLK